MIDLDLLEALAKKATPGDWFINATDSYGGYEIGNQAYLSDALSEEEFDAAWDTWESTYVPICESSSHSHAKGEITQHNLHFIAAANPTAVLRLIRRLQELEAWVGSQM